MVAPSGTLIAYATAPGSVAKDGEGANGTYTAALVDQMSEPSVEVAPMFRAVRTAVRKETDGSQTPWESSSVEGEFYFNLEGAKPRVPSEDRQPAAPVPKTSLSEPPVAGAVAVNIDSAQPVKLFRLSRDGGRVALCTSPCNERIDARDEQFVIGGDGVAETEPFSFGQEDVTIRVEPEEEESTLWWTLTIIGAGTITAGLVNLVVMAIAAGEGANEAPVHGAAAAGLGAAGLGLFIPGVVILSDQGDTTYEIERSGSNLTWRGVAPGIRLNVPF